MQKTDRKVFAWMCVASFTAAIEEVVSLASCSGTELTVG